MQTTDDHREATCPGCHISVAPYDTDRVLRRGAIYHKKCAPQEKPVARVTRDDKLLRLTFATQQRIQ